MPRCESTVRVFTYSENSGDFMLKIFVSEMERSCLILFRLLVL